MAVLLITVVVSLLSPKGRAQTYVAAARRHATEFLDIETEPAYCDEMFHRLLVEEEHLGAAGAIPGAGSGPRTS